MTARFDGAEDGVFARPATPVNVITPLVRLEQYVRARRYAGYDPYDALGSPTIRSVPSPTVRMALTQLLVYSPVDLRRPLRIAPGTNPKAIALFISSYCNMRRCGLMSPETFDEVTTGLVEELLRSQVSGYHGLCWGIYFDLQDGRSVIEPSMPSIVPTSFAGHAFLDLYDVTGEHRYLEHALSCCDFITNDLNILEAGEGICFSYRPEDHKAIHNANVMNTTMMPAAAITAKAPISSHCELSTALGVATFEVVMAMVNALCTLGEGLSAADRIRSMLRTTANNEPMITATPVRLNGDPRYTTAAMAHLRSDRPEPSLDSR